MTGRMIIPWPEALDDFLEREITAHQRHLQSRFVRLMLGSITRG